ncbi:class I SAM-dependent methyltransferase [Paramicrobacterium agarici]|uniref:Methyltransferase family protein n=1 Tax=Paramicrobacterium agarici TaxID=630514 RepID=A0A2A9DY99_9MICO|nr:class I SAM-dependent methyltransferase [Microbacterium agarici]PFG31658.1 methyltransferase family protein [Microbacterium agarici]
MSTMNAPRVRWPELDAIRRRAVATASGTVLEAGAGRGDNFGSFAPGITWIGLEPHAASRSALARTARARGHTHEVLDARCERIPLDDAHVDSVVATFVMCSVDDVAASLAEFYRVLVPGGRLVLVDHLAASPGTAMRRLQNLISPITRRLDKGCRYNREITADISAAGFTDVAAEWYRMDAFPGVTVPCAVHTARA